MESARTVSLYTFLIKCRNAGISVRQNSHECRIHVLGQTDEYDVQEVAGLVSVRWKRGGKRRERGVFTVADAQALISDMLKRPL